MTAFHRLAPHIARRDPEMSGVTAAVRRVIAAVIVAGTTGVAAAPAQQPSAPAPRRPPAQVAAQGGAPSGPPNALQGFSQNRDQPVKINADELQVHDKDKQAVFSGAVHLVQGDTDMRTAQLVVFYDDNPPPPAPASGKTSNASAQITPQQNQQIKRVEARGSVIVVKKQKGQKDQTVTGNEGIFDMRANTVTMVGKVIITQGDSTMSGDNLTVNMTTGDAVLTAKPVPSTKDGPAGKGRVQGLFTPSTMQQDGVALPGAKR